MVQTAIFFLTQMEISSATMASLSVEWITDINNLPEFEKEAISEISSDFWRRNPPIIVGAKYHKRLAVACNSLLLRGHCTSGYTLKYYLGHSAQELQTSMGRFSVPKSRGWSGDPKNYKSAANHAMGRRFSGYPSPLYFCSDIYTITLHK